MAEKPTSIDPALAGDLVINEDQALALLKKPDLLPDILEQLSKNPVVIKSRKAILALVGHAKTPRHVSLPLLRRLFTFDLMRVTLTPIVPGDIKRAAEESLIHRLETLAIGEKLSLARRASGRVAGELLLDPEPRVILAAIENPRLTEVPVVRTLLREDASPAFVLAICHHPKWSLRREVRIALLRNEKTPPERAVEIALGLPAKQVREGLRNSHLPASAKSQILKSLKSEK